jgi:hypothetical protein
MSWQSGIKLTKVAGDNDTWVLGPELSEEVFQKNCAQKLCETDGNAGYKFKFVVINGKGDVTWEEGANRTLLFTDGLLRVPKFPKSG